MSAIRDLVGRRFGRLKVVQPDSERDKYGHMRWTCLCDCGALTLIVLADNLLRGHTKSCGCLQREQAVKHGHAGKYENGQVIQKESPTYRSWASMIQRCWNKKAPNYSRYGGRGIKICKRWLGDHGFENFLKDMGKRPFGMNLDRRDNDRGYCKRNCRWASLAEQRANQRPRLVLDPLM